MEFVGEIVAFGIETIIFAICLKQYIYYKNAVKAIKDVKLHDVGSGLDDALDTSPNNKVGYIAVRGIVKPLGEPLQSINKKDVTGVIQKLSVREHVVAKSSTGFWSNEERVVQKVYNVVPFVLQKELYRVEVTDPLSADILDLDVISDRFEPSVPTFVDYIWGFFTGIRQRGLQSTEKMLRVDSVITAIGELSRSENRSDSLTLQPPLNGPPFYITSMSVTALVRNLDDRRKMYSNWRNRYTTLLEEQTGAKSSGGATAIARSISQKKTTESTG